MLFLGFAVIKVCLSIQVLMELPNPDDPLDNTVAEVYKTTPELARQYAAEWTKLYATSGS
jgi:ubiquitin-conjugating enzyme E2 N